VSARPVVDIRAGELPQQADGIEQALIGAGIPYYARGELLVRLAPAPSEPGKRVRRPSGAPILTEATATSVADDVERVADFQRWEMKDGEPKPKSADVPSRACQALLSRVGRWKFHPLRGIVEAPFVRPDGAVCATPGYDADSGLFVALSGDWPRMIERPTKADAVSALGELRHLLRTFPFVGPEDESVVLAAILTPMVRPSIDAAPLFGFSATVRGSGKGLLADTVAIIATGRTAAMLTWGQDEAENTKALTAALLASDSIITLDNVEVALRGELICSMMTQEKLRLRPLGHSKLVTVPCIATTLATGNALLPSGDMSRRSLIAELDPQVERPELREFPNDPRADALSNRHALVRAAITIIRAGIAANFRRPTPLGSYSQWSRMVRDSLIFAGMPDPVSVMERTFDADPEREAAIAVLHAWRTTYSDTPATAADAARAAEHDTTLRDALESVAGRAAGKISTKSLGRWMQRHAGRVIDGLRVEKAGGSPKHGASYRVRPFAVEGVSRVSGVSHNPSRERYGKYSVDGEGLKQTPQTPETPTADDYRRAKDGEL
jgi:putative DNA primase/helicase